jgi:hypothetical protein
MAYKTLKQIILDNPDREDHKDDILEWAKGVDEELARMRACVNHATISPLPLTTPEGLPVITMKGSADGE